MEVAGNGREGRHDLLDHHRYVPILRLNAARRRSRRTLQAHLVAAHQMFSPVSRAANSPGSFIAALYAVQRSGAHNSTWSFRPTTTVSLSMPIMARRFDGTSTRPCPSSSTGKAVANTERANSRARASPTRDRPAIWPERSSQAPFGKIARQPSTQRQMCDVPASSERNRAGTARRPLASIVWRYSPVNTPSSDSPLWATLDHLARDHTLAEGRVNTHFATFGGIRRLLFGRSTTARGEAGLRPPSASRIPPRHSWSASVTV